MDTFVAVCPNCQESRSFKTVSTVRELPAEARARRVVGRKIYGGWSPPDLYLAQCGDCGIGLLIGLDPSRVELGSAASFPAESPIKVSETQYHPPAIARALLEAGRCYAVGGYRGTGLLARFAIEQSANMLQVPRSRGTLAQKLGWLLEEHHLPARWKDAADTVRDVGNHAAHDGLDVSREDAQAVLRAAVVISQVLVGRNPLDGPPNPTEEDLRRKGYNDFLS